MTTLARTINLPVTHLQDVVSRHEGQAIWSEILIRDGRNRTVLISSPPGTPSDPHLHPDFNEWWVMLGGEIQWQIGEYEPFVAQEGDIIVAPCGHRHDIRPTGASQALRLVAGLPSSNHDLKGVPPARLVPFHSGATPPNLIHTPLAWMFERHGAEKAWAEEVILDQRNRANMIYTLPGQSSRPHWHPGFDEWWVVLKGELEWKVGNHSPFRARKGDLVFVEEGYLHGITTVGDEPSVRLAVTIPGQVHYFADDPGAPPPPRS